MKAVVAYAVFAFIALVQSIPIDEHEQPTNEMLVSELPGPDEVPLSEELAASGPSRRLCVPSQCYSLCRAPGYTTGLCSTNAYCVCFR